MNSDLPQWKLNGTHDSTVTVFLHVGMWVLDEVFFCVCNADDIQSIADERPLTLLKITKREYLSLQFSKGITQALHGS